MFPRAPLFYSIIAFIPSLLSLGCGPSFEKVFTTDHFEYFLEEGTTAPCGDVGSWLERYYEANARFFDARLPLGEKFDYYYVQTEASLDSMGCPNADGCFMGSTVYSTRPIHAHEIVHANASLVGDAPLLFAEGLAVVLGCTLTADDSGPIDRSLLLENYLDSGDYAKKRLENPGHLYLVSGSFVRHLLDFYGRDKFLAFYAHSSRQASADETRKQFLMNMGVTLDDALASWRIVAPHSASDICLRQMECDSSFPELTNGDIELGCGATGEYYSFTDAIFRVSLDEGQTLQIRTTPIETIPLPRAGLNLFHCNGGSAMAEGKDVSAASYDKDFQRVANPKWPSRNFVFDIPGNEYIAWFAASGPATVGVEVNRTASAVRENCQSANEPLLLKDNDDVVLSSHWKEHECVGFWCPGYGWDVKLGSKGGKIAVLPYRNSIHAWGETIQFPLYSPEKLFLCSEPCPTDKSKCEELILDLDRAFPTISTQVFAPGTVVHLGIPQTEMKTHLMLNVRVEIDKE